MTQSTRTPNPDGAAIRQIRREKGIKPGDMAQSVGVKRSTIYTLESGSRGASWELMYRIAGALDVPIQQLLRDEQVAS